MPKQFDEVADEVISSLARLRDIAKNAHGMTDIEVQKSLSMAIQRHTGLSTAECEQAKWRVYDAVGAIPRKRNGF